MYSTKIYNSWKTKQQQKYQELIPIISKYLNENMEVLDIGIGQGWMYNYFKFKKITGIEPYKEMMENKSPKIEYHQKKIENFKTTEKFDLLILFDSLHLIQEPKQILKYLKPNGIVLISIPMRHKNLLNQFKDNTILEQGKIGKEEIDYFILIKNQSL